MAINTQKLKAAIKTLMPATSSKDLILQMSHLVFKDECVLAYNDKLCIVHPLKTGVNASIPAEDLNKILSGITEEEVGIVVNGNEVVITSKTTTATVATEIESRIVEDFYTKLDFDSFDWKELPSNFLDKITLARFSVSSNTLDSDNLACICIDGGNVFSGDSYRLSLLEMNGEMDRVLIPGTVANDLIGFSDFDEYCIDSGWLYLSNASGIIVSCRIIVGDYPDFLPYFDAFDSIGEASLEMNLIPILQNLSTLVEGEASFMKSVSITISRGHTLISGKKEGLNIEKKVPNSHGGEELTFNVSPVFLAHILGVTNTLAVGENSALFEGTEFRHIVQLPID